MKKIVIKGIFVFIIGYLLCISVGGFFLDEKPNYNNSIIFAILYLSSVISVYTSLIIEEIKKNK
ncbi:permease [Vallitalea sp.]|jgi:uncharacterized membrane protein YfcA|uniref:permease n=1 Tax=Vallitalea sp. TaxID=1882829 RepID=UPI0025E837B5|nr:permease [Vallitalea sp.]MCT4688713.1 permease [Vallitalea sp.]